MKTQLITREGYNKLKQELDFLWREDRPEVTKKVTWAASLGDRSENADYQYNKNGCAKLTAACVISPNASSSCASWNTRRSRMAKCFLVPGSRLKTTTGDVKRFRIAGYDEIFGRNDYISIDSPMARALLKKEVGDLAVLSIRRLGKRMWYVGGDRLCKTDPNHRDAAAQSVARQLAISACNPYNCPPIS